MANLPVKWFHSMFRGIPQISRGVGKLKAVLDACLVDGFGQVPSISATITDNVLTINLPSGQTFELNSVVDVSGDDILKGEYRVINTDTTFIQLSVNLPNQAFVNTLYVKYASLGWTKVTPASSPNCALYIPKESHSGFRLWVKDDYTNAALVRICRGVASTSNVSSFQNLIDAVPYGEGSNCWLKSNDNTSGTRAFFLIGDGSLLYYQWCSTQYDNSYAYLRTGRTMVCGDINRYYPNDNYAAVLTNSIRNPNTFSSESSPDSFNLMSNRNSNYHNTAGNIYKTFLGSSRNVKGECFAGRVPNGPYSTSWSGRGGYAIEKSLTNNLSLQKILAVEEDLIRGEYPGSYFIPFAMESMVDLAFEKGAGDLQGKILLFKVSGTNEGDYDHGNPTVMAFDITGPWR